MNETVVRKRALSAKIISIRAAFARTPMLGWLVGILCAVFLERQFGDAPCI